MSKYLFIGSHADDIELSCGATIHKLLSNHEVHCLAFSYCNNDHLTYEYERSMAVLGVKHYSLNDFQNRIFPDQRQQILQVLINVQQKHNFDFIFTHSANSIHQDHKVVGEESLRAFKKHNLITYEHDWNLLQSESNYYIEVSEENMAKKLEAMSCYKSQQNRPYFDRQFTYSRALLAGAKIGVKYAEAFRIINMKG